MIDSTSCWMTNNCYKYTTDKSCQEQDVFCPKLFRLNYLYDNALLSNSQRQNTVLRCDSDGTDIQEFRQLKQISNNIEKFVNNGQNIFIHSHITGNGKTEWAIKLIQAYFNSIWWKTDFRCRALFINVPRLMLNIKDNISNPSEYIKHIKSNIETADIVVWDEIGTKAPTQFEFDNLFNMINVRIDNNKTNIYTSNLNENELKLVLGDRLYSRICNLSIDIEFHGADKRSNFKEVNNI